MTGLETLPGANRHGCHGRSSGRTRRRAESAAYGNRKEVRTVRKEIIVGYDGSPHAQTALMWALDEAARTGASIELVYVDGSPVLVPTARMLRPPEPLPDSCLTDIVNGTLERAVARAKKTQPLIDVTARTMRGHPATALIGLSRKAHLIVLGGTGHSAVTGLLGSVSTPVSAHSHCPVVIVRGEPADGAPVVVGVDGSASAATVLDFAAEQASARKAPLRVIRAWPPVTGLWEQTPMATNTVTGHEREPFDTLVTIVRNAFPDVTVEAEATVAHPAGVLTHASARAQLVVVGSRGHGAVSGLLLGSVSQHLLRHSACPVAVIHSRT
ncbi:universal stress protein [Actinoplanes xinjiangensis]|uniref:universal stress protein n=1 Tax=Actinoplanes xinjiangensis TaxID=512350 RepID=UPI003F4DB151